MALLAHLGPDLTPLACAALALLAGLGLGMVVGAKVAGWSFADDLRGGRWTRREFEGLVRRWRGPNGERR